MSGFEGATVIGFKAGEERIEHFPPGYNYDIDAFTRLVPPEDLAGKTLVPGYIDHHFHIADDPTMVPLFLATSVDPVLSRGS